MTEVTGVVRTSETDEVRRLLKEISGLESQFREQRAQLQKQGMSLPPGTLAGIQQVRGHLEEVSHQFDNVHIELQRLRELSRTAEVINSTLDLDSVLNEVMDTVIMLTRAERGYLMLRNPDSGALEFRVARNIEHRNLQENEFIISNTIVAEVAQSGTPVLTTNAGQDPRFQAQLSIVNFSLRSILCVPLALKGIVTGVVYADNRIRQGLFGERELELLKNFANQAAVAIENARLYTELQAALAEITAMKDLLANVFDSIASGVITVDGADRVTGINDTAERILNVQPGESIGQPLPSIWPVVQSDVLAAVRDEQREIAFAIDVASSDERVMNLALRLTPLRSDTGQDDGVAIVVDDETDERRREAQLNLVRLYLPPAMVDNIQDIDRLGLGGERRIVTTVFIDVRGFGSFSSSLTPQELMTALNAHLTIAADAVTQQNGVIDKYMANELMGLFNTQLNPTDDHPWRALYAALTMADEFEQFYRTNGEPQGQRFYRVGIHTGEATLGNVGSADRREFTAIGDCINLTHRLLENALPGQIVISETTFAHCQAHFESLSSRFEVVAREQLQVRGRREAPWVCRLMRTDR